MTFSDVAEYFSNYDLAIFLGASFSLPEESYLQFLLQYDFKKGTKSAQNGIPSIHTSQLLMDTLLGLLYCCHLLHNGASEKDPVSSLKGMQLNTFLNRSCCLVGQGEAIRW